MSDFRNDIGAHHRIFGAATSLVSSSPIKERLMSAYSQLWALSESNFPAELRPEWTSMMSDFNGKTGGIEEVNMTEEEGQALSEKILRFTRNMQEYLATSPS